MSNITLQTSEEVKEPVAFLFYTHLILKGEDGKPYIYTSKLASFPKPNTVSELSAYTWEELPKVGGWLGEKITPIYPGDKVTIQF